eukprot:3230995-Lingulodinium_polyedra.AAC.1
MAATSVCLAMPLSLSSAGVGPRALPVNDASAAVACAAAMGQRGAPRMPHTAEMAPMVYLGA